MCVLGAVQRAAHAEQRPGKDPVPIVEEVRLAPGPVWTGAENLAATGIRTPDRPARGESLYRLSYLAFFPPNTKEYLYYCFKSENRLST